MTRNIIQLLLFLSLLSCNNPTLPYFGIPGTSKEGEQIPHTVKPFEFTNQDNQPITQDYLKGKITVVDFFFSTCPSICPIMTRNMAKVQQEWSKNNTVQFLSHTVDPKTDTPEKLKRYAKRNNANTENWHFVTGEKEKLYSAGVYSYLVSASEDVLAPGGFLHSELFILVDEKLHIRGVYDGTNDKDIHRLNSEIKTLLNE